VGPYARGADSGKTPMFRKPGCLLAVVSLSVPLLGHCGGLVESSATGPSSGGTSASTGGSYGVAGNATGGTSASTAGAGGVSGNANRGGSPVVIASDAGAPCQLPPSDLDDSCTVNSDCVAVPGGDPCSPNCLAPCLAGAVNVRVAAMYTADFDRLSGGSWRSFFPPCSCPCAAGPCCRQGLCHSGCDPCSM
jgi:hypothetical protein